MILDEFFDLVHMLAPDLILDEAGHHSWAVAGFLVEKQLYFRRARFHCEVSELSEDMAHNVVNIAADRFNELAKSMPKSRIETSPGYWI